MLPDYTLCIWSILILLCSVGLPSLWTVLRKDPKRPLATKDLTMQEAVEVVLSIEPTEKDLKA